MRKYNPHAGLIVFWVKLYLKGYRRSLSELYRMPRKLSEPRQTPSNPKYVQKPYEKMLYLPQRFHVDGKAVLIVCITGGSVGKRYNQYTAIDEHSHLDALRHLKSRARTLQRFFLINMLKAFPFALKSVQTDSGFESTKTFRGTKAQTI